MKKVLSALTAAAVLTMAGAAMAASVVDSKHDLSTTGPQTTYRTNTQQVCVFCHTPHNSKETRALWNRNSASAASYKLYTSGVWDESAAWFATGTKGTIQSTSPSLMCMSCHDGSSLTAVKNKPKDVGSGAWSISSDTLGTNPSNLGTDLTNDHPINIDYATARTATQYGGTVPTLRTEASGFVVNAGVSLPLAKGKTVECNTCHNVHDPANVPFLRGSMGKSALCIACHLK